jgi:hypothetical protein
MPSFSSLSLFDNENFKKQIPPPRFGIIIKFDGINGLSYNIVILLKIF